MIAIVSLDPNDPDFLRLQVQNERESENMATMPQVDDPTKDETLDESINAVFGDKLALDVLEQEEKALEWLDKEEAKETISFPVDSAWLHADCGKPTLYEINPQTGEVSDTPHVGSTHGKVFKVNDSTPLLVDKQWCGLDVEADDGFDKETKAWVKQLVQPQVDAAEEHLQPHWPWKPFFDVLVAIDGDVTITGLLSCQGTLWHVNTDSFMVLCLGYTVSIAWEEVRSIRITDTGFVVHTSVS